MTAFPSRNIAYPLLQAVTAGMMLLVCLAVLPRPALGELVDHIVASVNNEVITASELSQTMALNERIGKHTEGRAELEAQTLEGLINRRLLVQESRRLKFVDVSGEEIEARIAQLRKRFENDGAFKDFLKSEDLTDQDLVRMVGEQLLVEKFVEKKVGLFVRVTRDDAERYFEAHAEQYPGKRFQDVQKEITAQLTEKMVAQQLDQYIAELRSKADIRVNPL